MLNPISGASTTNHSSPARLSMENDAHTAVGQPEIRSPQYQININNGEEKKDADKKGKGMGDLFGKFLEGLSAQLGKAFDALGELAGKAISTGAKLLGSVTEAIMKAIPFK